MAQETWIVIGPQIIDIERITSLKVSLIRGRINVVAHDEPGARIEIESLRGRPLEVTLDDDGGLRVEYPFLRWENFIEKFKAFNSRDLAEVSIAVPRHVAVKLGTISGTGLLHGLTADADVNTTSGDLLVDSCTGDLRTNTVSGELEIREHTGSVRSHTVSGSVTVSGDITTFNANTVSGLVTADLGVRSSAVKVTAISANVTLRRPANLGISAKVTTTSGQIIIDGERVSKSMPGRLVVDRSYGDGSVWLEVSSVSGDVTVLAGPPVEVPAASGDTIAMPATETDGSQS